MAASHLRRAGRKIVIIPGANQSTEELCGHTAMYWLICLVITALICTSCSREDPARFIGDQLTLPQAVDVSGCILEGYILGYAPPDFGPLSRLYVSGVQVQIESVIDGDHEPGGEYHGYLVSSPQNNLETMPDSDEKVLVFLAESGDHAGRREILKIASYNSDHVRQIRDVLQGE